MMFQSLAGLGARPTDAYYDPARPSWLPYWIDDLTESQNKAAYALSTGAAGPLGIAVSPVVAKPVSSSPYSNPPIPVPVSAPDMATDPTGVNADIDAQIEAQRVAQQQAVLDWAGAQNAQTPVDNASVGAVLNHIGNAMSNDPTSIASKYGPYILIGVVGAFLYAMGKK